MSSTSKKPYGRLREPFVFFVDRSLGAIDVPSALREALDTGERVEVHDDHFDQDTDDEAWLAVAGKKRWVALSKDPAVEKSPIALQALLKTRVAFFAMAKGNATGRQTGETIVHALPAIRRVLRRFRLPLIARVTLDGVVIVRWAEGRQLDKAKRIGRPKC